MPKRARRQRTPNLPPEAFQVPIAKPSQAVEDAGRQTPMAAPSPDLRREYSDVISDLKLTSLIFLALVAIMVVLSFFAI